MMPQDCHLIKEWVRGISRRRILFKLWRRGIHLVHRMQQRLDANGIKSETRAV
jgi:hypothetical protein